MKRFLKGNSALYIFVDEVSNGHYLLNTTLGIITLKFSDFL